MRHLKFRLLSLSALGTVVLCASPTINSASATLTITSYSFTSNSYSPTSINSNATANAINFTGSGINTQFLNANQLILEPATNSTTEAAAVANNSYFQFTVTPNPGYALNPTTLTFQADSPVGETPAGYGLRTSIDGFASDVATGSFGTSYTGYSVPLSSFQNLTTATTFRIYAYSVSNGNYGDQFESLALNGTVSAATAVPEPASLSLLGFGALGLLRRRSRRVIGV